MNSKTSLLEQLRIDRGEEERAPGQGPPPGQGSSGDGGPSNGLSRTERERAHRTLRRWRLIAAICAVLALGLGGFLSWQRFGYRLLGTSPAASDNAPASDGTSSAQATTGDAAGASGESSSASGTAAAASGAVAGSSSGTASEQAGAGLASVLDASGYIVAQRQATVSAKTTGRLRDLYIQEGQSVKAGEVIARLDDSNSLAALAQARAGVAQAEASMQAAQVALNDARPIYLRNEQERRAAVISAQDLDVAKQTYDAAQTNFAIQQAALAAARANLQVAERYQDDTVVRAPFTGVVTVKAAQPGDIVSPVSAGGGFTATGICTIVDMDSLEAEVDVSENFIHRVQAGQAATVRLNAYPDWAIPGNVVAIIPTADRSKATVKVRVGFKTRDARVLPEMGARVSFLGKAGEKS
jgi:RND family efflux transporter MFP subunit